jgi:hypothetical protein
MGKTLPAAAPEDNPPPPRRDNLHATAQATGIPIMPRLFGDLFNVAQYALDLTMTARYEWHGAARCTIGGKAARRALSAI